MRILFLDNHETFASTVVDQFLGAHDVTVVSTVNAALREYRAGAFDVALVDYDLDDEKGDTFVRTVRAENDQVLVVAISARAEGNERLIAAGATAVCPKLEFARIADVLESGLTSGSS